MTVGPHDQVTGKSAHPGRIIWNIESADVRGDFERLVAAGAIVVREPYGFDEEPDAAIATFADPDDNYFQLMSPMPRSLPRLPEARSRRGTRRPIPCQLDNSVCDTLLWPA